MLYGRDLTDFILKTFRMLFLLSHSSYDAIALLLRVIGQSEDYELLKLYFGHLEIG